MGTIYNKKCLICGKEFTATQDSARTCRQICRNALSIGRKIIGLGKVDTPMDVTIPVITPEPVITPVITPKTDDRNDIASKVNRSPLFTGPEIYEELKSQGIDSVKGENGAQILYKMIQFINSNGRQMLSEKALIESGIKMEELKDKKSISIGEYFIREDIYFESALDFVLGEKNYIITKNETIHILKAI